MYNRYIPQPDGTHRRNRVPDPTRHKSPPAPVHPAPPPVPSAVSDPPPCDNPPKGPPQPCESPKNTSVGSFLRQILPNNFDTGDLIVVLLLLLMAADCREDQNTALLTLALYLIM